MKSARRGDVISGRPQTGTRLKRHSWFDSRPSNALAHAENGPSRLPSRRAGMTTFGVTLAAAAALLPIPVAAQTELRLIVADSVTARPIPGALIELADSAGKRIWNGASDAEGRATARVRPGELTLVAMMYGYRPVGPSAFIAPDQDFIIIRILMPPAPVTLDSIAVAGRRRQPGPRDRWGFEWRRQHRPFGVFLSEGDLADQVTVTSVLRRLSGVRAETQAVGPALIYMRGSTVVAVDGHAVTCGPSVFRDGMIIHDGGSGAPIDDLVPLNDIKAIEVYRSAAEVPIEFERGPGSCGAIVVWTR